MLINPLKKSVDYKGLKSAGYRRINMDEKAKFQQEKIYSKNL